MLTMWVVFILTMVFTAFAQTLLQHNMAALALVIYYMLATLAIGFTFIFMMGGQTIFTVTGIIVTIIYVSLIFDVINKKADEELTNR